MSTKPPGKGEQRFVEDLARLLAPWGVPPVAARLYGYLLIRPHPVSLDQITADLLNPIIQHIHSLRARA